MKKLILSATVFLTLGAYMATAEPVVIGDPSKGSVITSLNDKDGSKVEITTTGIRVEDGKDSNDSSTDQIVAMAKAKDKGIGNVLVEVLVPLFFFLFLIAVIMGKRILEARTDEKRLQVLRLMVEKGQPLPESVINQMLEPKAKPEADSARQNYKRVRNAYGFTLAGLAFLAHMIIFNRWGSDNDLIPAVIFLALGIGGLAGIYLPKREEKPSV